VRTEQLRHDYPLLLRYTVFPLHPEIPDKGIALSDLFAGRGIDLAKSFERLRTVAAEVGLPLGERTRAYNSRNAQELGKWAEREGAGEVFHAAVYRAYFRDGRDISRPEELAVIAGDAGLAADEAMRVLQERRYSGDVDADWQRARELRISAVPTFRYQERTLVGFTTYQELCRLITA
jgi:predicted DsbA family dithiol-disulfide isomerase